MTITPSIPVASSNANDGSGTGLGADHVPDVVLRADFRMSGANESSVVGPPPPTLRQTSEPVKVPGGTEGVLHITMSGGSKRLTGSLTRPHGPAQMAMSQPMMLSLASVVSENSWNAAPFVFVQLGVPAPEMKKSNPNRGTPNKGFVEEPWYVVLGISDPLKVMLPSIEHSIGHDKLPLNVVNVAPV